MSYVVRNNVTHEGTLLLLDPGSATIGGVALRLTGGSVQRLGGIVVPTGTDEERLAALLQGGGVGVGVRPGGALIARGGADRLVAAAERLATALGVPVRLVDIGAAAGRMIDAWPDGRSDAHDLPAAAMVPRDAIERRRRCDAVLAALPELSRAEVADRLGDLAEAPARDRDVLNDRLRVASFADALARMGEEFSDVVRPLGAPILLLGGVAAAMSRGTLTIDAVAPVAGPGVAHLLLDPFGVLSALGDPELEASGLDHDGALSRGVASALLIPGGSLLVLGSIDGEVDADIAASSHTSTDGAVLSAVVSAGATTTAMISTGTASLRAALPGGAAGVAVTTVDLPAPRLVNLVAVGSGAYGSVTTKTPVAAPIELLPEAGGGAGFIPGRALIGDAVAGVVHVSDGDPDSAGWERARVAGILAVVSASPETVLRARAVGLRGVVVGSLSDGERDALLLSLERRIAAGVATEPFGLLVLSGRRAASRVADVRGLHGSEVWLSADPVGLLPRPTTGSASVRASAGDVLVIGGPHEGARGVWEGLLEASADDPIGAVRINGERFAIPLGDLQRRTA